MPYQWVCRPVPRKRSVYLLRWPSGPVFFAICLPINYLIVMSEFSSTQMMIPVRLNRLKSLHSCFCVIPATPSTSRRVTALGTGLKSVPKINNLRGHILATDGCFYGKIWSGLSGLSQAGLADWAVFSRIDCCYRIRGWGYIQPHFFTWS